MFSVILKIRKIAMFCLEKVLHGVFFILLLFLYKFEENENNFSRWIKTLAKRQKNEICPLTGKAGCVIKDHLSEPNDEISAVASLGFRCLYTIIAWVVLGKGIAPGTGFFVAMMLFQIPLGIDYVKFKPHDKIRQRLRKIGLIVTALFLFIGFIGLSNIIFIEKIDDVFCVKIANDFIAFKDLLINVNVIWWMLILSPVLTVVDWIVNSTPYEVESFNT